MRLPLLLQRTAQVSWLLGLSASSLSAQTWSTSPSSSVEPYYKASSAAAASGYKIHVVSMLTVNDPLVPDIGGYRMVGIPDGLGVINNGDDTFSLLMNHELSGGLAAGGLTTVQSVTNATSGAVTFVTNSPAGVTRAYGGKGAFVSEWLVNRTNLAATSGRDFNNPGKFFVWDRSNYAFRPFDATNDFHVSRLCSADLAPVSAFYNAASGKGTQNRIFLDGEEDGSRAMGARAFAHIASGPDKGSSYELPYLGLFPWENAVACPTPQDLTIVMGSEDAGLTDSQMYVYVGAKGTQGLDIEKAGLHGGLTYVVRVEVGGIQVTNETNARVLGLTNRVTSAAFKLFNEGDISNVSQGVLATNSLVNGTSFQRVEDGAWDPTHPNDFYFVTTGRATGANVTEATRLWRLRFTDLGNPQNGGTIDMMLEGTLGNGAASLATTPVMMDNLGFLPDGRIILQEDPGNNARLSKVWLFNPQTGELVDILTADPKFFQAGGAKFLTADEESSGVIDASQILGPGWVLLTIQGHRSIPGELVEDGQILAVHLEQTLLNAAATDIEPYYKPVPAAAGAGGFHVAAYSLLTVGETNHPAQANYRMVGVPDGLGAINNGNGTFTLLMNHELRGGDLPGGAGTITFATNATTGVITATTNAALGIARAHGGKGAFVSDWLFNSTNLSVISGADLMRTNGVHLADGAGGYRPFDPATDYHFSRFCSADLASVTAYYNPENGKGTQTRLFLNGEEDGGAFRGFYDGRAFAHIASGPEKGQSYELPRLGKMSWENAVACPVPQDLTLVMGLDDSELTNSQVYVYLGQKQTTGSEIHKAGLDNGLLYGLRVLNAGGKFVRAEDTANVLGSGTRQTLANFVLHPYGDVSGMTGTELDNASLANATTFQRVEDGAWDPSHPNDFYFTTTGRASGTNVTNPTRLWRLCFADVMKPLAGGTIEMVLEGPAGTGNALSATQPVMLDNLCILPNDGGIVLQEDPGNNDRLAKIWHFDPATTQLTMLAEADRKFFATGGSAFQTRDEESSGIIDASEVLGPGWLLFAVQSHQSIGGELVERGQIQALHLDRVPAYPSVRLAPSSQTSALGGSVTLAVTPAGTGPFAYQWLRGTTPILGATGATFTLYNLTLDQAGTAYSVVITGPDGSVTSAPATVKVNPANPVVTEPNAFFGMVIQGTPGATYRIESRPSLNTNAPFTTLTNLVLPSSPYLWLDTTAPANTIHKLYRLALP